MDRERLDSMLTRGIKVMKDISPVMTGESTKEHLISQVKEMVADHPAMLGWWGQDFTSNEKTRKNMALACQTLKEIDPNHPVIWTDSDCKQSLDSGVDACFVYFY